MYLYVCNHKDCIISGQTHKILYKSYERRQDVLYMGPVR